MNLWKSTQWSVGFALLMVSCASSTPHTPIVQDYGAFVVYTQGTTRVVPVTKWSAEVQKEGHWIIGATAKGFTHYSREILSKLPECEEEGSPVLCGGYCRETFGANGEPSAATSFGECGCDKVTQSGGCVSEGMDVPELVSVVGGERSLYGSGSPCQDGWEEGCSNAYDAWVVQGAQAEQGRLDVRNLSKAAYCREGSPGGGLPPTPALVLSVVMDSYETHLDEACEGRKRTEVDGTYPLLVSGRLCTVGVSTEPAGYSVNWWDCKPLTPDVCPSALDPCGGPRGFQPHLEDGEWWVANDEVHGLLRREESLWLLSPTTPPVKVGGAEEDPVSVLFVPDARALVAAMSNSVAK